MATEPPKYEPQEDPIPPQIAKPSEAVEYLTAIFRDDRTDVRLRVQSAIGVLGFWQANELNTIAGVLVQLNPTMEAMALEEVDPPSE